MNTHVCHWHRYPEISQALQIYLVQDDQPVVPTTLQGMLVRTFVAKDRPWFSSRLRQPYRETISEQMPS